VVDQVGRVDISFNAVGIPHPEILGTPMVDLDAEWFSLPITDYTRSYFLTARLAARRMVSAGSGVIMTVSAIRRGRASRCREGTVRPRPRRRALSRSLSAELAALRDPRPYPATERTPGNGQP
jgi:NAD(P)-dependent dehydrogenase (short-subunit alcohol dehydrogenase family)